MQRLEQQLNLKVTIEAFATPGKAICEKHYVNDEFLRANWIHKHREDEPVPSSHTPDVQKTVIWCQAPLDNPIPYLQHLEEQIQRGCEDMVGIALFPHWPNSQAQTMLSKWDKVHTFPAGTKLFTGAEPQPLQDQEKALGKGKRTRGPYTPPPRPTPWPVHIYKITRRAAQIDPSTGEETTAIQAQAGFFGKQQPYIFKARARASRIGMRVRTGVSYTLLNEEQTTAIKEQPSQLKNILVLGDTGATHSLIPLNVANQLGLEIDPNRRGSIILGDGHSGVPIRGQCIVPITIGKYSCEVPALIMDVDWGSTQHLVLGSDWITQHHAMLGAGDGKGPQLDIRGQSGREKHTIFAKKWESPRRTNLRRHWTA